MAIGSKTLHSDEEKSATERCQILGVSKIEILICNFVETFSLNFLQTCCLIFVILLFSELPNNFLLVYSTFFMAALCGTLLGLKIIKFNFIIFI